MPSLRRYNCSKCADFIHERFLSTPESFYTGCVHEWRGAGLATVRKYRLAPRRDQGTAYPRGLCARASNCGAAKADIALALANNLAV